MPVTGGKNIDSLIHIELHDLILTLMMIRHCIRGYICCGIAYCMSMHYMEESYADVGLT